MYWPLKYYRGLTQKQNLQRKRSATRRARMSWKNPKAYAPFKTDKGVNGKSSGYTQRWKRMFPESSGLKSASKLTGVPERLLKKSYDRGMAAWRTGHRPGATQQQWGYARAYSMLLCGKTHYSTDSDLVREAKKTQRARNWFKKTCGKE